MPAAIISWFGLDWRDGLLIAFLAYYIVNHGADRSLVLENMKMLERLSLAVRVNIDEILKLLGSEIGPDKKEKN